MRHAAFDGRIRALGLVAGGYNDPVAFRTGIGDAYHARLVDGTGGEAAMPGEEPFAYYGTARSESSGWVNRVTRLSIRELLTLDAVSAGPLVEPRPTLMVHGRTDAYCSPAAAQAMFDRITGPKRLEWLDTTNHIDLYDNPTFVQPAVDLLAAFFAEHL